MRISGQEWVEVSHFREERIPFYDRDSYLVIITDTRDQSIYLIFEESRGRVVRFFPNTKYEDLTDGKEESP